MDSIKAQNEVSDSVDQYNTHHQPLNARNDPQLQQPSTLFGQSQPSDSNPFLEADNDNSNYNDFSNNKNNAYSGFGQQKASEQRRTPQLSSTPTPVHEPPSPTHAASYPTASEEFLQVDGSNITLFSTLSPTHHQQDESQQQFEQPRSIVSDSFDAETNPFTFASTSNLPQSSSTSATTQTPQSFSNTSTHVSTSAETHAQPTTADFSTTSTKGLTPAEHESLKSKLEHHLPGHHATSAHSTSTTHTGEHKGLAEKITKHLPGHDSSKVDDEAKLQEQIKQGDIPPPHHFDWAEALKKEGFEHDTRLFAQHPEPIPVEHGGHHEAGSGGQHAPPGHFEAQSSATKQPEAATMQTQSRTAEEGLGLGRSTQALGSTQPSEEEFQPVAMHLGGSGQVDEFGSRELNSHEYERDSRAYPSSTTQDAYTSEGAAPLATLRSSHGTGSQFVHDGSAPTTQSNFAASSLPASSSVPYDRSTDAFSTSTAAPTTTATTTSLPTATSTAPTTSSSTSTTAPSTLSAHATPFTSTHSSPTTNVHTSPSTTSSRTASSTMSAHATPFTSAHTSPTTSAHTSPLTTTTASATSTTAPSTTSTHTTPHTSHDTTSTTDEHAHGLRAKLKHLKEKITGHHDDTHDVEGPSTVHKGPVDAHKDKPSTTAATDPPHPAQAVTQDTKHHFKIPHILYHPPKGRDLDAEKRANVAAAEDSLKEMAQVKLAGSEKFEQFWDAKNNEAEANKAAGITLPPGQMAEGPVEREEGDQVESTKEKQAVAGSDNLSTPATSGATSGVTSQQSATNAALPIEQHAEGIKERQGVSEGYASIPATGAVANQSATTAALPADNFQQQQTSATFLMDQQQQYQQSGLGIEQLPLEAGRMAHPQVEAVLAPSRGRPLLGQNCETPAIQTRDTPLLGAGCTAPNHHREGPILGANCVAPRSTDQLTEDSTLYNQANTSSTMHQSSHGVQAGERFSEYTSTPDLVIHASEQAHDSSTSSAALPTSSSPSDVISPLSQPPLRRMGSRDDSAPVPLEPSASSELDTTSPLSKPPLRRLSSQVIPSAESLANLNAAQTPSAVEHQQANTSSVQSSAGDRSASNLFSTPVHHMQASDFQASSPPTISVAVMRPATQMPGEQVPLTEAHHATPHGLQLAPSIHEQQRTSFSQPASSSPNLAPTTAFRLEPEASPVESPLVKVSDYNFGTTFREPKTTPTEEDDPESGLKGKVAHVAHAVKDVLKGGHRKTLSDIPTDDGSGHSKVPNPGLHVVAHDVPRD